jgi:hypothetical protein
MYDVENIPGISSILTMEDQDSIKKAKKKSGE